MCRLVQVDRQNPYFDFINTEIGYRRRGFCTSLLYYVLSNSNPSPELDIRKQATVMKRIATLYGYLSSGVA